MSTRRQGERSLSAVENRRYAIAAAAIKLFTERGLSETTVEDIAAEAAVAPRTFFRHFATKEDAAFPDHEQRISELRARLAERQSAVSPLGVALELSRASAHEFLEDPDLYLPRLQLFRRHPALRERERAYDQRYEDALAEYLAAELGGDAQASLKARVIAAAIVGAVNHPLDVWAAGGCVDPETALAESLELVRRAFAVIADPRGQSAGDDDLVVVVAASGEFKARLTDLLDEAGGQLWAKNKARPTRASRRR